MEHRERYMQLLSSIHRSALLRAVREQGYCATLKAVTVEVVDAGPLPYLRFDIESDAGFTAVSGGLLLDLAEVVSDAPDGRYYLPYVALTPSAQPGDLEHELEHVLGLLELLAAEPTYADDVERLGMENLKDSRLLGESAAFEVRKIFAFEAPIFGGDYDRGCRTIDVPLLPGLIVKYQCRSREEYVGLWMARYLKNLERRSLGRFPDCGGEIAGGIERATDRFGEPLFGRRAWMSLMSCWEGLPGRLAAQVTVRVRRRRLAP